MVKRTENEPRPRRRRAKRHLAVIARKRGSKPCPWCGTPKSQTWRKSKFIAGRRVCNRCSTEEQKSDGKVIVAPSRVAGRGLYAIQDFKTGQVITRFSGTEDEPGPRHEDDGSGKPTFRWLHGEGLDEDADVCKRPAVGHFANSNKRTQKRFNAVFGRQKIRDDPQGRKWRGVLRASKKIKAGEEIMTQYGDSYKL